jgi:hypothetical protein
MKKFMVLLLVVFTGNISNAQSSKSNIAKTTGYGGGVAELTFVNGSPALNIGGYGGVLINRRVLVGLSGNNILFKNTVNGVKHNMSFNYYGIYSEYRFPTKSILQVSSGITAALGWQENKLVNPSRENTRRDGNMTFVIQPKLGLNIRIAKFMQVQGYASYRFTGNTHSVYYNGANYNGASFGAALLFGGF